MTSLSPAEEALLGAVSDPLPGRLPHEIMEDITTHQDAIDRLLAELMGDPRGSVSTR